jgi:hypothetical protein
MLIRDDPDLLEERMSSPIQRGQPVWAKALLPGFILLFVV